MPTAALKFPSLPLAAGSAVPSLAPRPSWDCGTHDAENVPDQSQGGYGGTAPAHAPATPPAASLPRQTSEHAFSDWPETGTCLLPLYSRDHLAILSAFQKNTEDSHFTSLVQACQMRLGQISWGHQIEGLGWRRGERGILPATSWRRHQRWFKTGEARRKLGRRQPLARSCPFECLCVLPTPPK